MNFENIDTNLLRNSVNQCLESINYNSSENILQNITDNNVWQTSSRDTLKKSLDTLVNKDFKELENKLRQVLEAADIIDKYKKTSSDLAASSLLISELNEKLDITEKEYLAFKSEDLEKEEAINVKKSIDDIKKQIEDATKTLNNNDVELLKMKNQIESLIS